MVQVNLKRSRVESNSDRTGNQSTTSHCSSSSGIRTGVIVLNSNGRTTLKDTDVAATLYVDDGKGAIISDSDKELISPPAKLISKSLLETAVTAESSKRSSVPEPTTTADPDLENEDSEYSSLDDEEYDVDEDGGAEGGSDGDSRFLGEDLFDSMVFSSSECGGGGVNDPNNTVTGGPNAQLNLSLVSECVTSNRVIPAPLAPSLFPNVPLYLVSETLYIY